MKKEVPGMAPLGMDWFRSTIYTSYYIARSSRTQDKRRILRAGSLFGRLIKGLMYRHVSV